MEYAGLELREWNGHFYFEDLALAEKHDSKGPDYAKMKDFQRLNHLKVSRSKLFPQWLALLPPSMRGKKQDHFWNYWNIPVTKVMEKVNDHAVLFVRDGCYFYTTQPYDLKLEDYQNVERYWGNVGLSVDISYQSAWWFPGRTPLITISQQTRPLWTY